MSTQRVTASAVRAHYHSALEPYSGLRSTLSKLGVWVARSGQRRALRELAKDGRLLADIGLNRQQALCEATKPFWR